MSIEVVIHVPEGGDVPQTWYFTFGVGDPVNAGCYVVIRDATFVSAREQIVAVFGTKWAFQYNEAQWTKDDGRTQAEWWSLREIDLPA